MVEQQSIQEKTVAGSFFIGVVFLIIMGFYFITNQGLAFDDDIVRIFLIYSVLNFTLPIVTVVDLFIGVKWFKSLLFRPADSLINQLYQRNKKDKFLSFLNKINNNFLLGLVLWHIPFMLLGFLGSLFAPQSSMGIFLQNYVFPVRPQSVLGITGHELFFTLYPSISETGALTVIISIGTSLLNYVLSFVFSKIIITYIALVVVGTLISGIGWQLVHRTVSAGRQFDAFGHLIFGIESGLLIILTGQITPALALHNSNLFYWYLRDTLSSNEFIRYGFIWTMLIIFAIMLIYIMVRIRGSKK